MNKTARFLGLATLSLTAGALACSTPSPTGKAGHDDRSALSDKSAQNAVTLIRSDYAEGEVEHLCQTSIDLAKRRFDAVANVAPGDRNIDNTLLALESSFADYSDSMSPLTFMGAVSTREKIAAEGAACEEKQGKFDTETMSRKDLYEAIRGAQGRNEDEKRLVSETIRAFELNGLKLPDDKLAQVRELRSQLSALEAQFSANLNKDATTVEFDAKELEGVTADFLGRLKKSDGGKYIVTTKSTDYEQVMERAKNSETRRRMLLAYFSRAADKNVALLEQAIGLRGRIAGLMGFKTWADYRTQNRMVKNGTTVLEFLDGLKGKLAKRNRQDQAKLLKFMKELDPSKNELNLWDMAYASYQLKLRDFSLDDEKIREYFPTEVVIQGMFDVYSRLLGVKYVEVTDANVWSPDVKLYRVVNASDGAELSYFFTDFYPRSGKYGHAAAFTLIQGRRLAEGKYSKPVSSIVSNMNPASGGKPALMNHREVETLFHEFGHIMHQTLTRAPYASLSGSGTTRDFVEAPSQMLENWVWSPKMLSSLSGHYQDHSKKLPKDLLTKMIAARDFNQGYFYTRQLMLGLLDMDYHTIAPDSGPVNSTAVVDRLYREIIGLEPISGGRFQAGFGHLMGGYDSGYYGYLWSKVYAEDMFSLFEKGGLLSPVVGMKYRREILERGNMREAMDLLKNFLGREPSNEAFLRSLGLGAKKPVKARTDRT